MISRSGFKKSLLWSIVMMVLYTCLILKYYPYKGLIDITLTTLTVGASTFITSFIYLYLLETGNTSKVAIATIIPLLYVHLIRFIHQIFIDAFSDLSYVGKFLTETFYLTIGYIPFGIILFILNCNEKHKVAQ